MQKHTTALDRADCKLLVFMFCTEPDCHYGENSLLVCLGG